MQRIMKSRYIIVLKVLVVLVIMSYLEKLITTAHNSSRTLKAVKSEETGPIFMKNSCKLMVSTSKSTQ
jgi:hypothetical protein